ncbi:MAG: hypothetical protein FWC22_06720 [Treponema sp.]|nr:hypothetical protein [Treponema sp.]
MKKIISSIFIIAVFMSCAAKEKRFIPIPDSSYFEQKKTPEIAINDIIDTKDGRSTGNLPVWLRTYIEGGIEAVENLNLFYNKYVYIGINRGSNTTALNKWLVNYSAAHDFPVLAGERVEKKIITSSSLYPDDEYGEFFERFMKRAYGSSYPGAVKEDTFWIRTKADNESYIYFILLTIDKTAMQLIVGDMISQTEKSAVLTSSEAAAVRRMRQNFFEGF